MSRQARAQSDYEEGAWHHHRPPESPQHFAFEFRLGPYSPQIDDAFPANKPYATVFGTDHRVLVGLEIDWQVFRIPHVGTIGPGLGWSYTHITGTAPLATGGTSSESTFLTVMPMYGVGVLRVDEISRETPVPLVAYGKIGIGYGLWWTGNDLATQSKGHTWGTHYALGAMLLLDDFDPHAAAELDNEAGINNSYLFFEWMIANLDGFGQGGDPSILRIGTNTWVAGLAFEF